MGNILISLNLGLCWGQCNLGPHLLGKGKKKKEKIYPLPRECLKGGVWIHINQPCQGQLCLVKGKATGSALLHMRKSPRGWKRWSLSPSFSPFGQVSLTRARFPQKPVGIDFVPFRGRAAVTGKFGKANRFLGGKAACRRREEKCQRRRSHLEPVPACDTHKAPQPPAPRAMPLSTPWGVLLGFEN